VRSARIETISGSNTWNGVSSGAITASYAAEAAAATDNTPTMAAPTATVNKAHAFVPFSIEVGQDWGALEAEMGKLFQDSKDDLEGTQFVTGAGTTVFPQGFVTGTTATVAAATGLTVTAANVRTRWRRRSRRGSGRTRTSSPTARSTTSFAASTPRAARRCGCTSRRASPRSRRRRATPARRCWAAARGRRRRCRRPSSTRRRS
jgi:hypothetical protein